MKSTTQKPKCKQANYILRYTERKTSRNRTSLTKIRQRKWAFDYMKNVNPFKRKNTEISHKMHMCVFQGSSVNSALQKAWPARDPPGSHWDATVGWALAAGDS